MAVLPWGPSRKSSSGAAVSTKPAGREWFSRSGAEPSRQAISQLMKQHPRDGSSLSVMPYSRTGINSSPSPTKLAPRPTTASGATSKPASVRSSEKTTPTQSRPSTPVRVNTSMLERSDSSSRSLFHKAGLLRKSGSKLSLDSNSSSVPGVVSPLRTGHSRTTSRDQDSLSSPSKVDEAYRPSISKPFDFAHLMHGDVNNFTGLGRIDESELALQFDAIQARYNTDAELGNLSPTNPQNITLVSKPESIQRPATATQTLPSVPPKNAPPVPPPKDVAGLISALDDIQLSKSTENFSRPTSRSPFTIFSASPVGQSSSHLQYITGSTPMAEIASFEPKKPLPQIPSTNHAVSTRDDTARPLLATPLPQPPRDVAKVARRHQRQSSSKGSLRHISTFPSARNPHLGTLAQEAQLTRSNEDGLTRPHSDIELSHRAHGRSDVPRLSIDERPHLEDWEVAIDSAWDFDDEAEFGVANAELTPSPFRRPESVLLIEQPQPGAASSSSTPLMTMASLKCSDSFVTPEHFSVDAHDELVDSNKEHGVILVGLGIETVSCPTTSPAVPRPPPLEVFTSSITRPNGSPRLTRSTHSAISHSSSQESIILSIASSIMSTQRSSMSSVSASEYSPSLKHERVFASNVAHSPSFLETSQKAARPESGCLPSMFLSATKMESNKSARPDSTSLAPSSDYGRHSAIPGSTQHELPNLSEHTLTTLPTPETESCKYYASVGQNLELVAEKGDSVADLPQSDRHQRPHNGSRASVSSRASSVLTGDGSQTSPPGSSTQSSKMRSARVSYSLFPITAPTTHTSSAIDLGGATS